MGSPVTPLPTPNSAGSYSAGSVNITHARRDVMFYSLTDAELETVAAVGSSIWLALFCLSAGVLVTLLVTTATITIADTQKQIAFSRYTGLAEASASIFFVLTLVGVLKKRTLLTQIKRAGTQ
jgi:hypothetical protein